jgi:hypothetical protein
MIDRNPGVEDRARLEREGYLVVRDFFHKDSVAQLMKWTQELEMAPEVPGPGASGFKTHQDQQAGWSAYAPLFLTVMVTIVAASHGDLRARHFADKHASLPPDIDRDREKTYVFRV